MPRSKSFAFPTSPRGDDRFPTCTVQATMLCNLPGAHNGLLNLLIFQQTRNKIRSHDALFDHNRLNLPRNFAVNLAGIYIKFDSSAPCVLVQKTSRKRLLRRLLILYRLLCLTACLTRGMSDLHDSYIVQV